jgi:preprotein translocase subunit SecG
MSHTLSNISSFAFLFVGLLLIFVILLQRGRGGGLAGAFGGAGGQSAFGTKAGDVFTRITIGIAIVWVALAVLTGYAMSYESGRGLYNAPVADSDASTEGAAEATPNAGPPDPFEKGSQEKTPTKDADKSKDSAKAKDAAKAKDTVPKSPAASTDKSAPATKPASDPSTDKSK